MSDELITQEISLLKSKLSAVPGIPQELQAKINQMLVRLARSAQMGGSYGEDYERTSHYLDWIVGLPWDTTTQDNLDLANARQILDKHHYGLTDVKERLLEFISILKLNQEAGHDHIAKAPILLLVGLVGTGKTTFAYSLAEAMNRQLVRIPFGGLGSARDLRGRSRLHLESEPGAIIKALSRVKTKNPVILLDEIDRISEESRSDVMGVLVELLDPEQNARYIDHYIDYPFDLSQVLFIATANGVSHIATAVMDRMEPISMPSYTDEEKLAIAKDYLLPRTLSDIALPPNALIIDETVWPQIIRPLGYDAGIRSLKRTLEGVIRKGAKEYLQNNHQAIHINGQNIKDYLPTYRTELI
jgi:ATP-dependent Lon protease